MRHGSSSYSGVEIWPGKKSRSSRVHGRGRETRRSRWIPGVKVSGRDSIITLLKWWHYYSGRTLTRWKLGEMRNRGRSHMIELSTGGTRCNSYGMHTEIEFRKVIIVFREGLLGCWCRPGPEPGRTICGG
jgi:hypothetical protein